MVFHLSEAECVAMPHVPVKKKGKRQRRHRRRRFRTTSSSSTASSSSSSTSKRSSLSRLGPPSTSSTFSTSWIKQLPDRLTKDHQRIQVVDDVSDVPEADFATEVVVTDSDEMMAEEAAGAADVPDPPSEDEPAPGPSQPGTSHLEIWQVLQPYKLVTPNQTGTSGQATGWISQQGRASLALNGSHPSDTVLGPSVLGLADRDGGDHVGQWHAPSAAMQPSLQPTLQPVTVQAASRPVMLQAAQPLCLQPPVTRVKPVRMQLPMAGVGRRVNHIPAHMQHLIAGAAGSPPPPPPPAPPPAHGNAVRPRPHAKPKPGPIVKMNVWFKNGVLRTFLQGHSR